MSAVTPRILTFTATANKVLGTLSILYGGFLIVGHLLWVSQGMPPGGSVAQPHFNDYARAWLPNYSLIQFGVAVCMVLLGALLITSGFGLSRLEGWSRWFCIGFSMATLAYQMPYGFYKVVHVYPLAKKFLLSQGQWSSAAPPPGAETGVAIGFFGVLSLEVGVLVGYSLILLFVMTRASVRAAFADAARVSSTGPLVPGNG
jgi:hypothetical protein